MIAPLIIYALVTVTILCIIEKIRIAKARKEGKKNIGHWLSVGFAVVACFLCWWTKSVISWQFIPYAIGCVGIRLLLWDFALALWRRQNPFKNSLTSDSKTEQFENKYKIGFWWQRILGALGIAVAVLINYYIK